MLNKAKQNQKQYTKLYKQFEKAFYKMYDFAQTNKVDGCSWCVWFRLVKGLCLLIDLIFSAWET